MSKITDKDKKDWKNFIFGKGKIEDKDNFNIKPKEKEFLKFIDLHGYTLEQANKTISRFIEKCYVEDVSKVKGKGSVNVRTGNITRGFLEISAQLHGRRAARVRTNPVSANRESETRVAPGVAEQLFAWGKGGNTGKDA